MTTSSTNQPESEKKMPIISFNNYAKLNPACPKEVPFALLDERQAQKNHMQTLDRLAERGGLCPSEMIAVMDKRDWCRVDEARTIDLINIRIAEYYSPLVSPSTKKVSGDKNAGVEEAKSAHEMIADYLIDTICRQAILKENKIYILGDDVISLMQSYATQQTQSATGEMVERIRELERLLSVRDLQVEALVMQLETNNLKPII